MKKHLFSVLILIFVMALVFSSCKDDTVTQDNPQMPAPSATATLLINEYMSSNTRIIYDSDGDYDDWVEIYNNSDSDIDVAGYFLSDDSDVTDKWSFPQGVVIPARGYRMVFLSDKNKMTATGELHAGFKLGSEDDALILSAPDGKTVDEVELQELSENISCGRSAAESAKFVFYTSPTPGAANSGAEFAQLSLALAQPAALPAVYINEVSAAQDRSDADESVYDWIELYNSSSQPVNLNGYGLCKNITSKNRLIFDESAVIEAGGYLLVKAVGADGVADGGFSGILAPFKVDSSGDDILLLDSSGSVSDSFSSGKQVIGVSSGRQGASQRVFFAQPTENAANSPTVFTSYAPPVSFSRPGGFADKGDKVEITAAADCEIHYTTDGSVPELSDTLYTQPIEITSTLCLRARAFSANGAVLPGDIVTETYVVELTHDIPVITLASEPDGLFSDSDGIYAMGYGAESEVPYLGANFWEEWERETSVGYYVDGVKQFEINAGINIFGQYSRANEQKSFAIHFRDDYGAGEITYPFFDGNEITTVEDLVLRANDPNLTKIRDEFAAQTVKNATEVAIMDWTPAAVYINGEYWGLYFIREKINESYLESHYGVDKDNVDIVKGDSFAVSGDMDAYKQLVSFARNNDLSDDANYSVICSMMDVDDYIDYLLFEIFFYNTDSGNIKCYRERSEGSKFRWVFFDLDNSMYQTANNSEASSLYMYFTASGHGYNHMFPNTLHKALIENDEFYNKFITRYAELLNTIFMPSNLTGIIDSMASEISAEMVNQIERWTYISSLDSWHNSVDYLKKVATERRDICIDQLQEHFGLSDAKMRELHLTGSVG